MIALHPYPEHKFAFGLWTVGNPGRDPFGDVTRPPIEPWDFVYRLADLGGWGISFHDDDLVPPGATAQDRATIVDRFRKALEDTGVVVSMATTNLFWHPAFKDGAFTAADRDVRRYAIQKTMRAIDLGAELGADIHVFWGGREGAEAVAAKPPADALDRYREALNFQCGYVRDEGYPTRFALEPKPNEPRGDTFLPTVGHALAFIETLDHPDMVGVNPEFAHEKMAGLSVYHGVAQAIWAGKLFHVAAKTRIADPDRVKGVKTIGGSPHTDHPLERARPPARPDRTAEPAVSPAPAQRTTRDAHHRTPHQSVPQHATIALTGCPPRLETWKLRQLPSSQVRGHLHVRRAAPTKIRSVDSG